MSESTARLPAVGRVVWLIVVIALVGCTARSGLVEGTPTLSDGRVLSNATTRVRNYSGQDIVIFRMTLL